jgi:fatty acid desaturase
MDKVNKFHSKKLTYFKKTRTATKIEEISAAKGHIFLSMPAKWFWVFLSGKEIPGRKRLAIPSNYIFLLVSVAWGILGVLGIIYALNEAAYRTMVYVASIILIIGSGRYMVATNIHMLVHNLMFNNRRTNYFLGEILCTILLIQSYPKYLNDHIRVHHGKSFGTLKDGDAITVVKLGFTAGKTTRQLWINLLILCVSPVFHFNFIKGRLKENLIACTPRRKIMTLTWLGTLGFISYRFGPSLVLHAYVIPILFLGQIASLIQMLTEHIWISTDLPNRKRHELLTYGRFCGVCPPKKESSTIRYVFARALWITQILFIELPARIVFFQGTLPVHDWHHRNSGHKNWANGAMLREYAIQNELQIHGHVSYREVWGAINILNHALDNISRSSPYPNVEELLRDSVDYGDIK